MVFFQSENEIQYLVFSNSNGDFLNDTYDNFFYMGKSLSLPEPFAYFDVSVVYDLFYVLNNDRILVFNNRNIPIHNFKPLLEDMEHIQCLKAFRKYLPQPTDQQEDDSSYYNHNDLLIILTNHQKLMIYDVAQMAAGSESIFKIGEFDLADLFDLPIQPNDLSEFSLSPDSSLLYLKSKELGAIFFLKINSRYLTCASTNQLCLNIGERLRADSRTIQPKPFFPDKISKENSIAKGKRASLSGNKLSDGNRRIYHTFFEFATCQIMPTNSLSYCVAFPSKQDCPRDQPFALSNMDIIAVYVLSNEFALLDFKLRLTILDYFKTSKDSSVQINLNQKFDGVLESSNSLSNKKNDVGKSSAVKENEVNLENFPPEIPDVIRLLCMKSKEKASSANQESDFHSTERKPEISQFDKDQNAPALKNTNDLPASELLKDTSQKNKTQAESNIAEEHHLHRTPEYEHLPPVNRDGKQDRPKSTNQTEIQEKSLEKVSGMVNLEDLENIMMKNVKMITENEPRNNAAEQKQLPEITNKPNAPAKEVPNPIVPSDRRQSVEDREAQDQGKQAASRNKKRESKTQKQNDEAFAQSLSDLLIAFHDKIIGTVNQFADESKKNIVKEIQGHLQGALKDNNKHFVGEFISEFEKIINLQIDRLVQKSSEKFAVIADKTMQRVSQKIDSTETAYSELAATFNNVFKAHQETTAKISQFIMANKDALTPQNAQSEQVTLTKAELKEINDGLQAIKENQKAVKEKLWALGQRVTILEIQRTQVPSSESLSRLPSNPVYRPMPKQANPAYPYCQEYPHSDQELHSNLMNHYDLMHAKMPYPHQPAHNQQQMQAQQWNSPPIRPNIPHHFSMSEPHGWPSNIPSLYHVRVPPRVEQSQAMHQTPVSFAPPKDQAPSTSQLPHYYPPNVPMK